MRALVLKISGAVLAVVVVGSVTVGSGLFKGGNAAIAHSTGPQAVPIALTKGAPMPYTQGQPGNGPMPTGSQQGWPATNPGTPTVAYQSSAPGSQVQPGHGYDPAPNQPAPQADPSSDDDAPDGMTQVPSRAGHVYVAQIDGDSGASQLVGQARSTVQDYFDGPVNMSGVQSNQGDDVAQTTFTASVDGTPVTGMISAIIDSDGGGHVYVMYDDASRVQQTAQIMMNAMYETEARFPTGSGTQQ